ncbi:MAG: putative bifunctional diguanylate cyclase/phosphodiesterase [Rubrivivax sp.]
MSLRPPRGLSLRNQVLGGTVLMVLAAATLLAQAWTAFDRMQHATERAEHSHHLQLLGQTLLRTAGEVMLSQGSKTARESTLQALDSLQAEVTIVAAQDPALNTTLPIVAAVRAETQALLSLRLIEADDDASLARYGRLIHHMERLLPEVQAAHLRAEAHAAAAAHTTGAWLVGGKLGLVLLCAAAGWTLLRRLDQQLGGDPRIAHQVSARIADGELDTPVPHSHPRSVLAALEHVRVRLLERRSLEQRAQYLASHDTLSGAVNRAHFNDLLTLGIEQARRDGHGLAMLFIDLDRFKEVNDTLGHAQGDEVIRISAQRLRGLLRQGDQLARLGGDEFAVLVRAVRDRADLERLAQRVTQALAEPMTLGGQVARVGASVGVALLDAQVADREDLMQRADLAMYRAKAEGRGGFSVYDEQLDAKLRDRRELVQDLRGALDAQQLFLHYQPIYARDGQALLGYEALLRWRHPTRGLVPPDEFVPLAEDAGLIQTLGRWVLHQACADAATWPAHLTVAVNLSVAQLEASDLVPSVAHALDLAGLPAQRLNVEITESMLMTHREQTLRAFEGLAALGVGIVVDDFGTGYSSLAYLWRFDFDKLKIDRSFINDLQPDTRVHTVVRSIISMAHALGMRVTAEGVERPEQMRLLQQEQCDELQGYLLGRPGAGPGAAQSASEGSPSATVDHTTHSTTAPRAATPPAGHPAALA